MAILPREALPGATGVSDPFYEATGDCQLLNEQSEMLLNTWLARRDKMEVLCTYTKSFYRMND